MIGLAVTREGIPVRVLCWPGITNDMSVITEVKDGLRGWRLGRVVTVVDRSFSSDENLRYLPRAGGHWRRPPPPLRNGMFDRCLVGLVGDLPDEACELASDGNGDGRAFLRPFPIEV